MHKVRGFKLVIAKSNLTRLATTKRHLEKLKPVQKHTDIKKPTDIERYSKQATLTSRIA